MLYLVHKKYAPWGAQLQSKVSTPARKVQIEAGNVTGPESTARCAVCTLWLWREHSFFASATGPKDFVASWTPLSLYYT